MATKLTKKNTKKVKPVKSVKHSAAKESNFTRGLGRRKTSVARVRIFAGKQEITVNGKAVSKFWPDVNLKPLFLEAFTLTNTLGKFSASAKIVGGGTKSQIGAFTHGVARAFAALDPEAYKEILKEKGLLTRDPRMKETRKVGQGGKARFKKQSPKR